MAAFDVESGANFSIPEVFPSNSPRGDFLVSPVETTGWGRPRKARDGWSISTSQKRLSRLQSHSSVQGEEVRTKRKLALSQVSGFCHAVHMSVCVLQRACVFPHFQLPIPETKRNIAELGPAHTAAALLPKPIVVLLSFKNPGVPGQAPYRRGQACIWQKPEGAVYRMSISCIASKPEKQYLLPAEKK